MAVTDLLPHRYWAAVALLLGTFICTLNGAILNVPLRDVARDLGAPIAAASLLVTALNLTFASAMPVASWVGSRFGRRRVFCLATLTLGLSAGAAMLVSDLPLLVGLRVVQGLASAAVTPNVMSIMVELFGLDRRAHALGAWASANGLGQALGPVCGGMLAGMVGWHAVFAPALPFGLLACAVALRFVPADSPRRLVLHWRGAVTLTTGAASLLTAMVLLPLLGAASPLVVTLGAAGVFLLIGFARLIRSAPHPFVSPHIFREPSYLRSSLGVLAQMFCFGAVLLGLPLYLTGRGDVSMSATGLIVFALPLTMALCAPLAGGLVNRLGAKLTLRGALLVIGLGEAAVAILVAWGNRNLVLAVTSLVVLGLGMAGAQTSAASGALRSEAGRSGTSIGFFNLVRFAGSTIGAAWTAMVLGFSSQPYVLLFSSCGLAAILGFAGTFAGASGIGFVSREANAP
jgi:MFS family permease